MWIFTLFWQLYPEHTHTERQGSPEHNQTPDHSHVWSLSWVETCFTDSAADISDTRVCTAGNGGYKPAVKKKKRDSLHSGYKFKTNSFWKNSDILQNMQEKSSPIWDETSLHNSNRECLKRGHCGRKTPPPKKTILQKRLNEVIHQTAGDDD